MRLAMPALKSSVFVLQQDQSRIGRTANDCVAWGGGGHGQGISVMTGGAMNTTSATRRRKLGPSPLRPKVSSAAPCRPQADSSCDDALSDVSSASCGGRSRASSGNAGGYKGYTYQQDVDTYLCGAYTGGVQGQGRWKGTDAFASNQPLLGGKWAARSRSRCGITVAVRVRPMTAKDFEMGAEHVTVSMHQRSTVVVDPTAFMAASTQQQRGPGSDSAELNLSVWARRFEFDHCYWSCSREDSHYADQVAVFEDLGVSMLDAAWQGINCSLLAYGQTGSGKSYSMMGTGGVLDGRVPLEQHGLIPRLGGALFDRIEREREEAERNGSTTEYMVQVSYMEIYTDNVYDLLPDRPNVPAKGRKSLRVREHPQTGAYVDGLSVTSVADYGEMAQLLEYGGASRTVASTTMNGQSSRSHSVFTIIFRQVAVDAEKQVVTEKAARLHLVDLAGSERVNNTGASGLRLKEANSINKSLATLADVISALAGHAPRSKACNGLPSGSYVPYRNSTLTWLLKDSLGGNAKTCMLATISPADLHYAETVSTLQYAERVKRVQNYVVVNEASSRIEPVAPPASAASSAAAAAGLEAEVMRLKHQLQQLRTSADPPPPPLYHRGSSGGVDEVASPLSSIASATSRDLRNGPSTLGYTCVHMALVGDDIDTSSPRLVNLNQDPLFSETMTYYIREGVTIIGSDAAACNIHLSGEDIQPHHCCITNSGGRFTIFPFSSDCVTFLNGRLVSTSNRTLVKTSAQPTPVEPTMLHHLGRLTLGRHHLFRFEHATGAAVEQEEQVVDWDFAHRELLQSAHYRQVVLGKECWAETYEADVEVAQQGTSADVPRAAPPPTPTRIDQGDKEKALVRATTPSPPPPPTTPPPLLEGHHSTGAEAAWRTRSTIRAKLAGRPASRLSAPLFAAPLYMREEQLVDAHRVDANNGALVSYASPSIKSSEAIDGNVMSMADVSSKVHPGGGGPALVAGISGCGGVISASPARSEDARSLRSVSPGLRRARRASSRSPLTLVAREEGRTGRKVGVEEVVPWVEPRDQLLRRGVQDEQDRDEVAWGSHLLTQALERAERAESERAEISQLLAAREKDIAQLKRSLEKGRCRPGQGLRHDRLGRNVDMCGYLYTSSEHADDALDDPPSWCTE